MKPIDWEYVGPKNVTRREIEETADDNFPTTYSGTAWLAVKRLLLSGVSAKNLSDPFHLPEAAHRALTGLGLTGFQAGWACAAARVISGFKPGKSGAVIEIGSGPVDQMVDGPAAIEMKRTLSGLADKEEHHADT